MIYTEDQTMKAVSGEASIGTVYKLFRTIVDEPNENEDVIKLNEAKNMVEKGIKLKFDIFYILKNKIYLVKNKWITIENVGRWNIREYEEEKYKRESLMRRIIQDHTESKKITMRR